jgi:hypothetical protein
MKLLDKQRVSHIYDGMYYHYNPFWKCEVYTIIGKLKGNAMVFRQKVGDIIINELFFG